MFSRGPELWPRRGRERADLTGEGAGWRPRPGKRWRPGTWLALGAMAFVLSGCGEGAPTGRGAKAGAPMAPRAVRTARVTEQPIERSVVALGSLMVHEHATLSAKVAGRLQSIEVDLGSLVKPGDVLARIEPRDYELKVSQAAAALAQARVALGLPLEGDNDRIDLEEVSAVKQNRALLDEAKSNYERVKSLAGEKLISLSEVDAAKSAYLVALNRCLDTQEKARQQQAVVMQRRVEWEIAKQQLTDTVIKAPFEGGIQDRRADVGEYFNVGTPVVTVVRLDPLCLRVEVSERDATQVRAGQELRFALEGDTNVHTVAIQRVSPALDETNRMLVIEADVKNDGRFHPGCFARAEIIIAKGAPALAIPTNAVIAFAGIEKAFIVKAGKAVEKRVTTGRAAREGVEVLSGLALGDEVVLDPGSLQTGYPVVAGAGKP